MTAIGVEEVNAFRSDLQSIDVRKVNGIRKLHQIVTKKECHAGIFTRDFACLCHNCITGKVDECQSWKTSEYFIDGKDEMKVKWHAFEEEEECESDESDVEDEIEYLECTTGSTTDTEG